MLIPMPKAHLSRAVYFPPAEFALVYQQALCLDSDCFEHKTIFDSINDDNKALVSVCRSLNLNNSQQNLLGLGNNPALGRHVELVLKEFSKKNWQ